MVKRIALIMMATLFFAACSSNAEDRYDKPDSDINEQHLSSFESDILLSSSNSEATSLPTANDSSSSKEDSSTSSSRMTDVSKSEGSSSASQLSSENISVSSKAGTVVNREMYYNNIWPCLNSMYTDYGGERFDGEKIVIYAVNSKAEQNIEQQITALYPDAVNITYERVQYPLQSLLRIFNLLLNEKKKEYNIWDVSIDYENNAIAVEINKNKKFSNALLDFINQDPDGGCIVQRDITVKTSGSQPAYASKIASMRPVEFPYMNEAEKNILYNAEACLVINPDDYGGMCFYYDTLYIFTINESSVKEAVKKYLPESLKVSYLKSNTSLNDLTRLYKSLESNQKKYNIRNLAFLSERNIVTIETYDNEMASSLQEFIKKDPNGSHVIREDIRDPPAN